MEVSFGRTWRLQVKVELKVQSLTYWQQSRKSSGLTNHSVCFTTYWIDIDRSKVCCSSCRSSRIRMGVACIESNKQENGNHCTAKPGSISWTHPSSWCGCMGTCLYDLFELIKGVLSSVQECEARLPQGNLECHQLERCESTCKGCWSLLSLLNILFADHSCTFIFMDIWEIRNTTLCWFGWMKIWPPVKNL